MPRRVLFPVLSYQLPPSCGVKSSVRGPLESVSTRRAPMHLRLRSHNHFRPVYSIHPVFRTRFSSTGFRSQRVSLHAVLVHSSIPKNPTRAHASLFRQDLQLLWPSLSQYQHLQHQSVPRSSQIDTRESPGSQQHSSSPVCSRLSSASLPQGFSGFCVVVWP